MNYRSSSRQCPQKRSAKCLPRAAAIREGRIHESRICLEKTNHGFTILWQRNEVEPSIDAIYYRGPTLGTFPGPIKGARQAISSRACSGCIDCAGQWGFESLRRSFRATCIPHGWDDQDRQSVV